MSGKNQKEFQKLVQKYLDGEASTDEKNALDDYYLLFRDEPDQTSLLSDKQLFLLEQRLENGLFTRIHQPAKAWRMWPRIASVAATVAVIVFGASLFVYHKQQNTNITTNATDITPGKIGATLTLSNGKKIRLSDAANGEIAKEAGISVTKTADGQIVYEIKETTSIENNINTLTTAKGETYVLTLPDKSRVWMNAASSLTYSTSLNEHNERRVKLDGEAYFQIAKDKAHPFIVESKDQEVEVLGTHFNINSYGDDKIVRTTLLEGSVKVVFQKGERTEKILKPGQQSILLPDNRIAIKEVDVKEAVAWRDGKFIFDREDMGTIMRKVARWYNVEVIFEDDIQNKQITGSVSRYANLSELLKVLETTGRAHFKTEDRKVIITK
ncbi:FecR family protein [Pedobacter psychrotolerans]|uniref:FecR family protein n=1 Tax=Pedobacter psychrotolerans TaxID=1843235 RepID=UPI003F9C1CA4